MVQKINDLDPNESHGHYLISIRMLKLHCPSLCKPLLTNFKSCLSQMKFPMGWKKTNGFRSTQKKISSASKTTSLFLLCFRSAVTSSKDFYLTNLQIF